MRGRQGGFSLIELVAVMVIAGIMAAGVAVFIRGPVVGAMAQARRAALTDAASLALMQMSRDLRVALPNSVRVGGGALELLHTVAGERYRAEPPGPPQARLDIGSADASFNTFGPLGAQATYSDHHLAVYPLGQPGADPYQDAVLSPATTITVAATAGPGTSGTEYRVGLGTAHAFPFDSPSRRVYLVDGAVSYLCDGGYLRRYAGYAFGAAQPVTPGDFPPGTRADVITARVDNCQFSYQTLATARRDGLASLAITLAHSGEQVRLVRHVHVDNLP